MRFLLIGSYTPYMLGFRGPLLRTLVAKGHDVHAIAPLEDVSSEKQTELLASFEKMDIHFHAVPLARTGVDPLRDLAYLKALRHKIKEIAPDRILAYNIKPIIYGGLAARSLGHKHYYPLFSGLGFSFSEDKSLKKKIISPIVTSLLKGAIRKARAVIFQNPDDRALVATKNIFTSDQPTHVVNGSGVDMDYYGGQLLSSPPQHPSFLMICRILVDKGVREYAKAAEILKAKYPDSRFVLVGPLDDANLNSPDQQEVDSWHAIDHLGSIDDVRPHLKDCSVFVLPSYYREGVPRSILEAMATGRAIITTDRPGCRETVSDGENGFFTPVQDAKALAQTMERFITDPQLCITMGKASFETAKQKYDVDLVNADLFEIMQIDN